MHISILTADYTLKPVLSGHSNEEDQLSLNAGQKYCREHSAILSTFSKLHFTVLTTYMNFLFCGVSRLTVR